MNNWEEAYKQWITYDQLDPSLKNTLEKMKDDYQQLADAFYKELTFGTAGMRGIVGPGTNRMNIYTVRKVVYGLANYLLENCVNVEDRGVVVAYDSRYMSREFAIETAKVLGTFGIRTYVFQSLRPTPLLSFAVRYLGSVAGIVITASHNPPQYNGLKVYNEDGGQMIPKEADELVAKIEQIKGQFAVSVLEQQELEEEELLVWIGKEIDRAYLDWLMQITKLDREELTKEKELNIVFTPLHGTSHNLIVQGLKQLNFTNVNVVEEQAIPDPEFSTVQLPNPEEREAFTLAIKKGHEIHADILLATDPDADRLGVAVKDKEGEYTILTGNQLGVLLIDYLLSKTDPILLNYLRVIKSIVTTEMATAVAKSYGVKIVNTLTGFKYIAEKIRKYDETGETFLFGFEESYGYLISSFVRDKDAIQAAVMTAEMAHEWKQRGKTLLDALHILYEKYGYYREETLSITLEGKKGSDQIQMIMDSARTQPFTHIAGCKVEKVEDYLFRTVTDLSGDVTEPIDLPKENVLKFILEDNNWVCLRPSGTEPKIKCYYGVKGKNQSDSEQILASLQSYMENFIANIINVTK